MFYRGIFSLALFLLAASSQSTAHAIELVVMNTDAATVPGAKVYTVGVEVTQADVSAALATKSGGDTPLLVQEVDFVGNVLNSQQTTPFNYQSLQTIQSQYIDNAAYNNPVPPGSASGPPMNLSAAGDNALYASSWWYVSDSGQLGGVNDSSGNTGVITANPAADGSGVYTIGPTSNVGSTGLDWIAYPQSDPGTPGMTMTGVIYGSHSSSGLFVGDLSESPVSDQFVNGVLTVPLAQVVTNGNLSFDFGTTPNSSDPNVTYANNFLGVGGYYATNFMGGNWLVDPHAVLDYSTNTIHSLLAGGGGLSTVGGMQVSPAMIVTNGDLTSTYTATSATNLAQTIGPAAAGQINFALAGSTVQAWEVQYTGTLQGTNTVVFHYDPTLIGNTPESELRIEHFVNGAWAVPAGEVVDTVAHTITLQADSFSPFVLSQVPEPSSVVLICAGAIAVGISWRLRRKKC
ncbi:MAG TPA: PEP-CTERM sorting domain-containing protein [Pirellulales bacterium]